MLLKLNEIFVETSDGRYSLEKIYNLFQEKFREEEEKWTKMRGGFIPFGSVTHSDDPYGDLWQIE
ncbi:MAG: hypothetical protein WC511_01640 [Candidatus Pacearchaeota archaeon]